MRHILVVSPVKEERREMAHLLADPATWGVVETGNLQQALTMARLVPLDLIVLDIASPKIDAESFAEAMADEQPLLPIIVVTDAEHEPQAREALRTTAAGCVSRDRLAHELASVVHRVLAVVHCPTGQMSVHSLPTRQETVFELENDPDCVAPVVQHVTSQCCRFGVTAEQDQVRVAIALEEALLNSIIHGNLQISSELRERSDGAFRTLVHQRRRDPAFAARRVRLNCELSPQRARIVICDEGPGFDVSQLPDPRDPEHLGRASGRGVLLMRSFMDEVIYNAAGNEVTLVKRRREDQRSSSSLEQSCPGQ